MEQLTQQDFHALLECLRSFYTQLDLEGFTQQVFSALPQVVPEEGIMYGEMNPPRRRVVAVSEPAKLSSPKNQLLFAQYLHEHPFISHPQRTRDGRAMRISDLLTQDQYHRLALYNELCRPDGVEHQMAIALPAPPPLLIGITLTRSQRQRDFSERDRLVLDLLLPHLAQAYHNAEALGQMQQVQARLGQAMEASDQGVILLTREGRVQWMTRQARRWLADYFGKRIRGDRLLSLRPGPTNCGSSKTSFPQGDRILSLQAKPSHPHLPEELERWVQAQRARLAQKDQIPPPREPLVVEREGRRLLVRLVEGRPEACPGPRSGACPGLDPGSFPLLLLEEEHTAFSAASLESLGLGRREAEVLFWVAQGKTNPEAAMILGVSPRTVQKHLERIYQKLEVPTRTAAITQALEALGLIKG